MKALIFGQAIVSLIDLRRRPDGLINTPPVAQIASPQYVIVNTTTVIKIPVSDVNTGDDLRCRWAQKNGYCLRNQFVNFRFFFYNRIRKKSQGITNDYSSQEKDE